MNEMTARERQIIPELFDIARNLPEDKQKYLVRLGKDLLFMALCDKDEQ